MNIYDKASEIARNGFARKSVYEFFDTCNKDIIDYIVLFSCFGVSQKRVWDAYEDWQDI